MSYTAIQLYAFMICPFSSHSFIVYIHVTADFSLNPAEGRRRRTRRRRRMVEEPLHWSCQWDQDYFFPSLSILDGWKFSRISDMWRWVGTGNNIRYMEVVGGHW